VAHARQNLLLHTSLGDEWTWNAGGGTELLDGRTDGLLLVLPEPHSAVIARCRREGFPYVALVYAPEDEDVYAVNADDVAGGRFPTGNAPPTHRYDADSRSRPNEIASWKPRIGTYAKPSRSPWVNSELPRSSASSATRRQGNLNQS